MKKLIWAILIVLASSTSSLAGSSVWVVQTGSGSVTYLGGTCHLLRQSDHPLPMAYNQAYQNSDMLAFETDIGKLQSPQFQQTLLQQSVYTDGSTLDKVLSAPVYKELNTAYSKVGIPLAQLNNLKPFMAFFTLLGLEFQKIGVSSEAGVDQYYFNKARADGKPIDGLETVDAQLKFLTTMADGIEDRFITHGLKDLKRVNQLFEELISSWRGGDEDQLYQFFIKDMINDFPKLYKRLVDDRNMNWMPRITHYLKTPEKEFVLVGVAHLVGPQGIVELLKKQGYKVTKVEK